MKVYRPVLAVDHMFDNVGAGSAERITEPLSASSTTSDRFRITILTIRASPFWNLLLLPPLPRNPEGPRSHPRQSVHHRNSTDHPHYRLPKSVVVLNELARLFIATRQRGIVVIGHGKIVVIPNWVRQFPPFPVFPPNRIAFKTWNTTTHGSVKLPPRRCRFPSARWESTI